MPASVNDLQYVALSAPDLAAWAPTVYEMSSHITDQWGTGRIIPGNVPYAEVKPDAALWREPA